VTYHHDYKIWLIVCTAGLLAVSIITVGAVVGSTRYYEAVKVLQAKCLEHGGSYFARNDWCVIPGTEIEIESKYPWQK
jgi:adenosylmethionine-8-amino-7-oxononanoate aminotransferase